MMVVEVILIVLAAVTLSQVTVVAIECVAAVMSRRRAGDSIAFESGRPRTAILIPAHNESASIAGTVRYVREQLTDNDFVVVVADNCEDDTAALAREAGAAVVERRDDTRRGKGYALAAGVDAMREDPPDVMIVVDADCVLENRSVDALVAQVMRTNRPAQAAYVMELPSDPTPRDAVSGFAFLFKNLVRPTGLAVLHQPCLLTGSGMAFPWEALATAKLATGDIVEDMRLGIELAIAGHPPMFCPDARVRSVLPEQTSAATSQRTRWEHGHLRTLLHCAPRLKLQALLQMRPALASLAAELAVPPLSLFVGWMVVLLVGAALLAGFGYTWAPLLLVGIAWALLTLAVLLGWWRFARRQISFGLLLTAPLYMLWKLPMYARFFVSPQKRWVRTARSDRTTAPNAGEGGRL